MSYHDDFECYCPEEDQYYSEMQRYENIKADAEFGYWTTKGDKVIHVSKMETSHIKNCIRYLERHDKVDMYLPWIERFKEELKARGEVK